MTKNPVIRHIDAWVIGFLTFMLSGWLIDRQELPNSLYLIALSLALTVGYLDYKYGSRLV